MRTKPIDEVIAQQVRFSSRAFGPGPRTEGLRKHIDKELDEISQDPFDVLEWIDVVILGLDGAWRAAAAQNPWLHETDLGKFVADALLYKIGVNMERDWPDWREAGQDQPIEHKRTAITQAEWAHQHAQNPRPQVVCHHCLGSGKQRRLYSNEMEALCAFCRGRGHVEDKRT